MYGKDHSKLTYLDSKIAGCSSLKLHGICTFFKPIIENGDLDWLDAANITVPKGEDCGYRAFMESVDVLVMGRASFEKVLSFGDWPYERKPVVVLSSHSLEVAVALQDRVSHCNSSPQALCASLAQEGVERIYLDGGITIQSFLAAGLVDDLTITVIPVLLGQGRPLFGALPADIALKISTSKTYEFGFAQVTYQVVKDE